MVAPFFFCTNLVSGTSDHSGCILTTFGTLLGSFWGPWDRFWSILEALFGSKSGLGRHMCPKRRHPRFGVTFLGSFWGSFFIHFHMFGAKTCAPEPRPFFSSNLGRIDQSTRSRRALNESSWGSFFDPNVTFGVENWSQKVVPEKGAPPDSNGELLTDPEAPGAAASRAHCSNKKQLFEQQLKHCSKFLQKKVVWAQTSCRKRWSGLKIGEIAETCRLLKVAAKH